jgi:hypothetical protein
MGSDLRTEAIRRGLPRPWEVVVVAGAIQAVSGNRSASAWQPTSSSTVAMIVSTSLGLLYPSVPEAAVHASRRG